MNDVMRNAQTFLDLIQSSKTETAGCWNREALQRAIKWAEYFEGVYKKLCSRPDAVTKFNRGLQIINSQPGAAPGPRPVTFDQLQQSRRLLLKSLLQNPYLSSDLYRMVLDCYNGLPVLQDGTSGNDMLNQDATECAHAKAVRSTLLEMKALTSEAVNRTDRTHLDHQTSVNEVEIETDASILRQHVIHHLTANPAPESVDYLHNKLHKLALKPNGIEIISRVASHLPCQNDKEKTEEYLQSTISNEMRCKDFVSDWLVKNRNKYNSKGFAPKR